MRKNKLVAKVAESGKLGIAGVFAGAFCLAFCIVYTVICYAKRRD